jgi:hypothetical protein
MATYSQDVGILFNGVPFQEVTGLSWSFGGANRGRSVPFTDTPGTVSISTLGTANTSPTLFGRRGALLIGGSGITLSRPAQWESVAVTYEVNGLIRYTVTLRLLDN